MRLSAFPYVTVRLRCDVCGRAGSYRLARLAAKFGAGADLEDVLAGVSADCPTRAPRRERSPQGYLSECGARFLDVQGPPRPPDVPAAVRRPRLVAKR